MRNTVSTYIRRLRCIYNKAVENGEAAFIPSLFKGVFTGVESQRKKSLPLGDLNRLMTVPVKGEGSTLLRPSPRERQLRRWKTGRASASATLPPTASVFSTRPSGWKSSRI